MLPLLRRFSAARDHDLGQGTVRMGLVDGHACCRMAASSSVSLVPRLAGSTCVEAAMCDRCERTRTSRLDGEPKGQRSASRSQSGREHGRFVCCGRSWCLWLSMRFSTGQGQRMKERKDGSPALFPAAACPERPLRFEPSSTTKIGPGNYMEFASESECRGPQCKADFTWLTMPQPL